MNRTIAVFLGEMPREVGTLRFNAQGARESAAFEYHPDWLQAEGSFAIAPSLPLTPGPQYHKRVGDGSVFHGAIADTEPDGWGRNVIRRDHAKRRVAARRAGEPVETSQLNSLDFLLAVDDANRVGALRFQDENGIFQRASEEGRRTAPPLIELRDLMSATRAVETNKETAADLAYLRGRATSLGGLRPKCSVVDDAGHLSIGKFPSVQDDRAVTKGEVLALRLARVAGITAADAQLINNEAGPVAVIRRFDRTANGARRAYISAATMLGSPADGSEPHTYTEIIDSIRQHGADAQTDIDELWRRIAFYILITNVDDHLRNHGFLHATHSQWRLAPAFDVNPFPESARELKTWISEDTGPEASIDALMSITRYCRIDDPKARRILTEVEHAVSRWPEEGQALGMTATELDQFADAFEHRERDAIRNVLDAARL